MLIDIVMISRIGLGDGGRETWLYNFLIETLCRNVDIRFRIFCLPVDGNSILGTKDFVNESRVSKVEVPCNSKKIPISLQFALSLRKAYTQVKEKADIIIGVGGLPEALAIILSGQKNADISEKVMWLRTVYTKEKSDSLPVVSIPVVKFFEKYVLNKKFGTVIANGEDTAAFYREMGVACTVIPNAISLSKFQRPKKRRSDKLRVAFVGRLAEVKGIRDFLLLVQASHEAGILDQVEYHVVGVGPFSDTVKKYHLDNKLVYHGYLSNLEMSGFLNDIDCCVALTYFTPTMGGGGVSNALIEQMAASQIIIAWDNVIFKNALKDSECFFVRQGDIKELFSIIKNVAIYDDAEEKAEQAKKGKGCGTRVARLSKAHWAGR